MKTFTSITIPLVLPAILAGMRYLFIHSMTAISATIFLVSVHWTLITTRILECMTELQFAQACAFSIVLIVLVFIASGVINPACSGTLPQRRRHRSSLIMSISLELRGICRTYVKDNETFWRSTT